MNYPFRMCLGEAFFLSRWLLFCHNCFPEVPLGRRNAASHRYVYTNIAHRHFRPSQRAQHHQIIEIAQMPTHSRRIGILDLEPVRQAVPPIYEDNAGRGLPFTNASITRTGASAAT